MEKITQWSSNIATMIFTNEKWAEYTIWTEKLKEKRPLW
jgi:hypothetical protein